MSLSGAFNAVENPGGYFKSQARLQPVLLLIAFSFFAFLVIIPPPQSMVDLVSREKPVGYPLLQGTSTITECVNHKLRPEGHYGWQAPLWISCRIFHLKGTTWPSVSVWPRAS